MESWSRAREHRGESRDVEGFGGGEGSCAGSTRAEEKGVGERSDGVSLFRPRNGVVGRNINRRQIEFRCRGRSVNVNVRG